LLINIVKKGRYLDSVLLMSAAKQIREMDGIQEASLLMGTENSK